MRPYASVLHLDLDAFFASVEQRDKPSLRNKPVVVGGIGGRGVVSTASYEARRFGIHSAMSTAQARRLNPHAAYLTGRFGAYKESSQAVMALLREISPQLEQLSIDEAYLDLTKADVDIENPTALLQLAQNIKTQLFTRTEGLTASIGLGSSKLMAKIGSELSKPDGIKLIKPGEELQILSPLPARSIPGIGPATMQKLQRLGVSTVADLQKLSSTELNREVGKTLGEMLRNLSYAQDERDIVDTREAKSISLETTFEEDIYSPEQLAEIVAQQGAKVAQRIQKAHLFARTITLKVRLADFTTLSRSRTLGGATDLAETIIQAGQGLLSGVKISDGVRLLGLGVHNFTEAGQEELFAYDDSTKVEEARELASRDELMQNTTSWGQSNTPLWLPGEDVWHTEYGRGWVHGSGLGLVTVRFESRHTTVGRVRTFPIDTPDLEHTSHESLAWILQTEAKR